MTAEFPLHHEQAMVALRLELAKERAVCGDFRDPHEGYSVILEEVYEIWQEVKAQHPDPEKLYSVAIQVACTAIRFSAEVAAPRMVSPERAAP